jgi:DNA helicase-2/ATP-dependent DNA helicase PcrA
MTWNDGLEGVALAIAGTQDRPLRLMAGPGTGKTFALKRMVARLLTEGVLPRRILVVTFTRAAAADLKREVRALDVEGCSEVSAGTLHSFCFSLLSRNEVFRYLQRGARPLVTFLSIGVARFEAEPLLYDLSHPGQFGGVRSAPDRSKLSRRRGLDCSPINQAGPWTRPLSNNRPKKQNCSESYFRTAKLTP